MRVCVLGMYTSHNHVACCFHLFRLLSLLLLVELSQFGKSWPQDHGVIVNFAAQVLPSTMGLDGTSPLNYVRRSLG